MVRLWSWRKAKDDSRIFIGESKNEALSSCDFFTGVIPFCNHIARGSIWDLHLRCPVLCLDLVVFHNLRHCSHSLRPDVSPCEYNLRQRGKVNCLFFSLLFTFEIRNLLEILTSPKLIVCDQEWKGLEISFSFDAQYYSSLKNLKKEDVIQSIFDEDRFFTIFLLQSI